MGCGLNWATVAMETRKGFPAKRNLSPLSWCLLFAVRFMLTHRGPGPHPGHTASTKKGHSVVYGADVCVWMMGGWGQRRQTGTHVTCECDELKVCCLTVHVVQAAADSTVGYTWEHRQTPTGLIPPHTGHPLEKNKQTKNTSADSHVCARINSQLPPVKCPCTDSSLLLSLSQSCQSRSAQNSVYLFWQSLTNTQLWESF